MNLINCVVAERATIDYFSIDSIMSVIFKSHETKKESGLLDKICGYFGKLTMTQYTYEGLGGMMQAQVRDGQKVGMFEVVGFEDDMLGDFYCFSQSYRRISLEQKAALYWSMKIPDCCLVSESELVLDYAQQLGVPNMSIEEMQEEFFADVELEPTEDSLPSLSLTGPFDPRVDADKVEAAFSDGLEGDLAVLKQKSYWVVVCVLFEWFGWLRLRKRADFCKWVNAHFHFESKGSVFFMVSEEKKDPIHTKVYRV